MRIEIIDKLEDVTSFLTLVKRGADSAKEELGFLPEKAYEEFALSGKLLVVTTVDGGEPKYGGHLMFGGIYPHAKIFQLFVDPQFRKMGIAGRLIGYLKERLIAHQWLSIKARVADNLAANDAWARMGFRVVKVRAGGSARNRQINVRVLDLETPSLLGLMGGFSHTEGLRLPKRSSQRPIYLIDLNVLFDTIRNRPRALSAAKIIRAALSNSIRLMVAAEFTAELRRTSNDIGNDPVLAFASQLDSLSRPPDRTVISLSDTLSRVIFPDRAGKGRLSDRDNSDLVHIATAIHHGAAGFITSEKAILQAGGYLHAHYGIDVVGVEAFARIVDVGIRVPRASTVDATSGPLRVRRNHEDDLRRARVFFEQLDADATFVEDALACKAGSQQWVIAEDQNGPVGFASWEVHGGLRRTSDAFLCIDERHHAADAVTDYLLDTASRDLSGVSPTLIRLHIPSGQVATRQTAQSMDFLPPTGTPNGVFFLQKLAIGRVVSSENWASIRQSLISVAALSLPANVPRSVAANRHLVVNLESKTVELSLNEIERSLAPVLFLFPGRDGIIVPIREHYARELLGSSPQSSMLSPPEAILRRERVYISAPRTSRLMAPGTPILFYESLRGDGRGCVIAIARIVDSKVVSKVQALDLVKRRGVLDNRTLEQRSVGKSVTETSFDNIFLFKSPVTLQRLRRLGCVDGANLISARSIPFEQLAQVVKEGHIDA